MDKVFLTILNMSLTGAFVIAAICLVRLALKRAPKFISYCLWAVVGFRLAVPFSIKSVFSLIPFQAQTIPQDIGVQLHPQIESGIYLLNSTVSSMLPAATPEADVNPLQIWISIGAIVWLTIAVAMALYGVISYVILKKKLGKALLMEGNIYEADNIQSPFVLGIIKPRIYLPLDLGMRERSYILLHEQTHIRRGDHLVKMGAYLLLCLHWFNPLAWVAFVLMGADMEMSCDEQVLRQMDNAIKKEYSLSLLLLATGKPIIGGTPLAFGEGGIKERVKNVLKFKKTSRIVMVVAIALAVVVSVGCSVNRLHPWDTISDDTAPSYLAAAPPTDYQPKLWVSLEDYDDPWTTTHDFMIDEFPGILFSRTMYEVTASSNDEIETILIGMPIWNIYLADLNGDGMPEICGTVSIGSGIIDNRIIVCDYANGNSYELSDRSAYNYNLSIVDNRLVVIQTGAWQDAESAVGHMAIIEGELVVFGIDRPQPEEEAASPQASDRAGSYYLENATRQQIFERLLSVQLYEDGTAWFQSPPISSYLPLQCTYAFVQDQLLIYIENEVIATFSVVDEETIVFESATVALFADKGARYVKSLSPMDALHNAFFDPEEETDLEKLHPITGRTLDETSLNDAAHIRGVFRELQEPDMFSLATFTMPPMTAIWGMLTESGYQVDNLFLISQHDDKVAVVYASYSDGDAIYCERYTCYLEEDSDQWTYQSEPWDGAALDVAAYVARQHYTKETGAAYEDVSLSLNLTEDESAPFGYNLDSYVYSFSVKAEGFETVHIIVRSNDGQSHWQIADYTENP